LKLIQILDEIHPIPPKVSTANRHLHMHFLWTKMEEGRQTAPLAPSLFVGDVNAPALDGQEQFPGGKHFQVQAE
jgi:hypothetical protein